MKFKQFILSVIAILLIIIASPITIVISTFLGLLCIIYTLIEINITIYKDIVKPKQKSEHDKETINKMDIIDAEIEEYFDRKDND